MDKARIRMAFKRFSEKEAKGSSPLYAQLSRGIAGDEELLKLSAKAHDGQPVPNLLFGAVHYLLLGGKDHPLKKYYPSITLNPSQLEEVFPVFKDFCLNYERDITCILETKNVQTNEVRRCAYLYPVFSYIHQLTGKPLALVEIGTSAGLQLLWDRYAYSYSDGQIYGNRESDLVLETEFRNGRPAVLLRDSPPVDSRIGVDLIQFDITEGENYEWLRALIWPEHSERVLHLEKAVKIFKENPPKLMEGDGVELLPEIAADIPDDSTLCIFHTHVANQMPENVREKLLETVSEIGKERDVFHIYNNIQDKLLHLEYVRGGKERHIVIGDADGHGRWIDWEWKE